jgi:GGDEF domain-containing protein
MTIDLNHMTPELKAALTQQLIADTFSSKAIHAAGDNLARALVRLASATQKTTDVAARWGGTVEVMAFPTAKKAVTSAKTVVVNFSGRVPTGVTAGCKAAAARKNNVTGFGC